MQPEWEGNATLRRSEEQKIVAVSVPINAGRANVGWQSIAGLQKSGRWEKSVSATFSAIGARRDITSWQRLTETVG